MTSTRRALCLGLLAVACDVKVGSERETKAPGRRSARSKRRGHGGGFDDDPAVVQAAVELEREAGLHLRLTGEAEGATSGGRTPAALREAVLRRGGGKIAPERVHVEGGGAGEVRFDFYVPPESTTSAEGTPPVEVTPPPTEASVPGPVSETSAASG